MKNYYLIFLFIYIFNFNFIKSEEIKISAAASLSGVIKEIIEEYKKENKIEFIENYGGSGTLRKQIENGADIDIAFFADKLDIEKLKKENLIYENLDLKSVKIYNTLVIVGNEKFKDFEKIKDEKIGIGDPKMVPVGKYAMEYLNYIKSYEKFIPNYIYAKDASALINYFELGEIDYAIVYKTEANRIKKEKYLVEINEKAHDEIEYGYAILRGKERKEVLNFYNFFNHSKSKKIFEKYGYLIK